MSTKDHQYSYADEADVGSVLPHTPSFDALEEVEFDTESHELHIPHKRCRYSIRQQGIDIVRRWGLMGSAWNLAITSIVLNFLLLLVLASPLSLSLKCNDPSLRVYSKSQNLTYLLSFLHPLLSYICFGSNSLQRRCTISSSTQPKFSPVDPELILHHIKGCHLMT